VYISLGGAKAKPLGKRRTDGSTVNRDDLIRRLKLVVLTLATYLALC